MLQNQPMVAFEPLKADGSGWAAAKGVLCHCGEGELSGDFLTYAHALLWPKAEVDRFRQASLREPPLKARHMQVGPCCSLRCRGCRLTEERTAALVMPLRGRLCATGERRRQMGVIECLQVPADAAYANGEAMPVGPVARLRRTCLSGGVAFDEPYEGLVESRKPKKTGERSCPARACRFTVVTCVYSCCRSAMQTGATPPPFSRLPQQ